MSVHRRDAGWATWLAVGLAVGLAVVLAVLGGAAWGAEVPSQEGQRIERLLTSLEQRAALTFERNGRRVSGPEAVRFLRAKWQHQGRGVATAEDFIERIASRSSTTGQEYLVCGLGPACTAAGPWLGGVLRELEGR